jgi:hypothetical protein
MAWLRGAWCLALGCAALACDPGEGDGPGRLTAPIVGGAAAEDPAVMMLLSYAPGKDPFKGDPSTRSCTATLVSAHVLVTAAHCLGGASPLDPGYSYWVYGGPSITSDPAPKLLAVASVAFEPRYVSGDFDVAVAVLADALTSVAPVALNRTALGQPQVGQPVRLVGYGVDNGAARSGGGTKRGTTTTLTSFSERQLELPGGRQVCFGDSGGPNFMTIGGSEVLVGITRAGLDAACTTGSRSMRMDAFTAFVDGHIAAHDPGQAPPPPGSCIATPEAFARQTYLDVKNRPPTDAELAAATAPFAKCAGNDGCIADQRSALVRELVLAGAACNAGDSAFRSGYIGSLYRTLLRREGEPAGVTFWIENLARHQDCTQSAKAFVLSTEYANRFKDCAP